MQKQRDEIQRTFSLSNVSSNSSRSLKEDHDHSKRITDDHRKYSSNGYEKPNTNWRLKRSRKGMQLNNPLAFNLKPESLCSVIGRITLLPLVGCSQLEYVMRKRLTQPCVPDSRYNLQADRHQTSVPRALPEDFSGWVIPLAPEGNNYQQEYVDPVGNETYSALYYGDGRRKNLHYHDIPRISKSDCKCCYGQCAAKRTYSDVYLPVGVVVSRVQSLPAPVSHVSRPVQSLPASVSRVSRPDLQNKNSIAPTHRSESASILSEDSSVYSKLMAEMTLPPKPRKKKGFYQTLCACCYGDEDDSHAVVVRPEAPRYVCKVAPSTTSGSSLQLDGGQQLQRRTRYICEIQS